MWNIKNEIIHAANKLNINISEIPESQTKILINSVANKYTNLKNTNFLWESFKNDFGIKNKNAWEWITKIINDKNDQEVIMFFNPNDESVAFRFYNKMDIVPILQNTYGFEFYLTSKTIDYVMCFNHHDFFITCGKAIEWLKEYLKKQKEENK